jgi:hypothetical protein
MLLSRTRYALALLASLAVVSGCGDDETSFVVSVENISSTYDFLDSGANSIPVGAEEAGPVTPGNAYEVIVAGPPGSRLSFASMFVMSNDYFYAPDPAGIALFDDDGVAVSGDITDMVYLWDAGTEINQEPGNGADQAPNQAAPDTGAADPNNKVRLASDAFGNLPEVRDVIRVRLTALSGNRFRLRIENVSTPTTLQFMGGDSAVYLAPVAWVVHTREGALFSVGEVAPVGLEAHAEDGDPTALVASLNASTGLTSPIAPGVFAVHGEDDSPFFSSGLVDRGEGLESLAEDGDPTVLQETLRTRTQVRDSGVFNTAEGAAGPGPAASGERYEFRIRARAGDRLSLATMLVQSNDLFFSFGPRGIALFDENDDPINGDVSDQLALWDVGTEQNEFPGAGPNQAPRQAGPDTGPSESLVITQPDDEFEYPPVRNFLRVTLTPR